MATTSEPGIGVSLEVTGLQWEWAVADLVMASPADAEASVPAVGLNRPDACRLSCGVKTRWLSMRKRAEAAQQATS